ncbi:MAG: hypothetical protein A3F15_02545 [Candidatus Wildermuthbacteria bacterium RIFCSPHIGHO2_12_FULL_40_12]|uniref:Uncharacterized protein n=1 Tax=Candidatus Wildermuthbacteria bacterium RIFCSPHIGHO2_12_FULL_40_12 TaxID=1802457 RepID=A0A1G2RGJ9_9BACT|nr:MAG: hypothetical protein A3F15_02545 [Candidatus Wildermuthbacteria bacterium RIFCSPHIGHO2_12_FULL_40_12]
MIETAHKEVILMDNQIAGVVAVFVAMVTIAVHCSFSDKWAKIAGFIQKVVTVAAIVWLLLLIDRSNIYLFLTNR